MPHETIRWLDDILDSLIFLTRLPVRRRSGAADRPLGQAVRGFAAAGAFVGGLMALIWIAAAAVLPGPWLPVLMAMAAGMVLTGGLHEDGLADVADGFGGGRGLERKLEIMRDSRIGSHGVLALTLVQAAMAAGLAELATRLSAPAFAALLIAVQALSRALVPVAMLWLAPVRPDGRAREAGAPDGASVLGGALVAAVLCGLAGWSAGSFALGAMLLAGGAAGYVVMHGLAVNQIGGQTGDVLGATQQFAALFAILAALSVAP